MRTDEGTQPAGSTAEEGDPFELLLARCIEARAAGDGALERLLAAHAGEAERIRARLDDLAQFGLLEESEPAPRVVAGHRIVAQLGRGGMGAVYLAREPDGHHVALKLASLALEDDEAGDRARARFEREVSAVAQLDHLCLVGIRASGEHEGRPWYTMDSVRGATLARVIERLRARGSPPGDLSATDARTTLAIELEASPIPALDAGDHDDAPAWSGSYVEWCCRVAVDVASALEHAHGRGVVHRDVKPSNILIRPDGRALLFDFGLAQVRDLPTLTRSGDFAGTPFSVAPEQVDGRRGKVDGRTDVWGLGVVLYELLTLRRPFDGAGPAALLRRVLEDDPLLLRRLHPGLPRALENVCATALEKSQARRYASAVALREDLERFLAGRTVHARGASPTRRAARFVRRRPAAAAALGLALLAAVGVPAGLIAANAVVREQARRTERAAAEASRLARANAEVVGYLVDLFEPLEADAAEADRGALAMLEAQAQRLEVGLGGQPLARAALLEATGTVFANLGDAARARPLYDRALAVRESELGQAHPDTVALLCKLVAVSLDAGDPRTALGLAQRALDGLAASGRPDGALAARVHTASARALAANGLAGEAAAELEDALVRWRAGEDGDDGALAEMLEELARVEDQRGRTAQALARCEAALALRRSTWLPEPRALARGLDLAADLRERLGDAPGAAADRDRARALRDALRSTAAVDPVPSQLELIEPKTPEYEESFQAGIAALQARRLDEARARFERCLELHAAPGVSLFNLACTDSLRGDVSGALDWLERAAESGFGLVPDQLELFRRDADLVALQGEPRFQALLARLERQGQVLSAYTREPALRLPTGGADGRSDGELPPLLVVLHADGQRKEAVVEGLWAEVADALGCVLLAPSAPRPRGPTPDSGLAWFEDVRDFARRPWDSEAAFAQALSDLLARRVVDPRRVLIAGEESGALVAFDLALRAPGMVRGVLLVHGPAYLEVPAARVRTAAALGLRAAALSDEDRPLPWVDPALAPSEYSSHLRAWLDANGLGGGTWQPTNVLPADHRERVDALVAALRALGQ